MKILDSGHCVAILCGILDLEGRIAPDEALASDIPLVTHNQRHFIPLVDLASLRLDDWL